MQKNVQPNHVFMMKSYLVIISPEHSEMFLKADLWPEKMNVRRCYPERARFTKQKVRFSSANENKSNGAFITGGKVHDLFPTPQMDTRPLPMDLASQDNAAGPFNGTGINNHDNDL